MGRRDKPGDDDVLLIPDFRLPTSDVRFSVPFLCACGHDRWMLVEAHAGPSAIADIVALIPARGGAFVCDATGACRHTGIEEARKLFRSGEVLIAHAAFVSGRLRAPPSLPLFDVMELFAFVRPAQPCVPS